MFDFGSYLMDFIERNAVFSHQWLYLKTGLRITYVGKRAAWNDWLRIRSEIPAYLEAGRN